MAAISGELERKLLTQDLLKERDSDEDGGVKTRVEIDSDFSLSEDEENLPEEQEDNSKTNWSEVLTQHRPKHNTGVKGVRADYEEAKRIMRRRNQTKQLQNEERFKQITKGISFEGESQAFSSNNHVKKYDADEEDNEDDDDDDDEFLAAYRAQRLNKINGLTQLPQFGRVIYVEKFEFLDQVDNADPRTFVVTHIYEEYIAACRRMNQILDQVAAKHPHVKILKLVATEASQTLSHRALPAFLVYKNKDMVNDSSIGVNEHEFGGDFGVQEVEWFLASRYGIELAGVDISEKEREQSILAGQHSTQEEDESWQPAKQPSIGTVNLLGNRLNKTLQLDDDDDW